MHKVRVEHTLETRDESLVNHVVKELEVVLTVVKCPAYAVLNEVFLQLHQTVKVHECNLRLYHPELRKVARGVGILGAERGTEGVDGTERGGTEFAFKLS